jgi:hypothetical protein
MKLISFKDRFPKKMSKLLLYNEKRNLEYDTHYFGKSPISEHNTYTYLVNKFTHWMYCDDLTKLTNAERLPRSYQNHLINNNYNQNGNTL